MCATVYLKAHPWRWLLAVLVLAATGAPVRGHWNQCPRGTSDGPAPGACGLYVDTDKDGICDRSHPPPGERTQSPRGRRPAGGRAPAPARKKRKRQPGGSGA